MLDRKWCNSARGMIASVIGRALTHQFWSVVLSILTLLPPRYILVYACSRSTISKIDQKTRTRPSSSSFSILSVAFSIEPIFFYSILSSRFQYTFPSRNTWACPSFLFFPISDFRFYNPSEKELNKRGTLGDCQHRNTPEKNKTHRITVKTVDETPTTLI